LECIVDLHKLFMQVIKHVPITSVGTRDNCYASLDKCPLIYRCINWLSPSRRVTNRDWRKLSPHSLTVWDIMPMEGELTIWW